jgi:hypothetical protein
MDPLDKLYLNTVLSKEAIRNHVDDYTLFCHYMEHPPDINVPVSSPLRADTRPSFALYYNKNGYLRFQDHGSGVGGDVFEFIRRLYGIGFHDVLRQINKDFGLGYNGVPSETKKIVRKEPVVQPRKKLEITSREFSQKAIKWWESFCISPEILRQYNVSQVDWLHWDGEPVKASDMTFAYRIWKYYKIYRPFVKTAKFMSTYPRNYVEGLLQLQYNTELLIITKSLKDVMVLRTLGYEAVSPKSESTAITQDIRDYLNKRYRRIVLLFDDDEGGHLGAEKYPEYEKLYIQEDEKDISDFIRKYGVDRAGQLMLKLLK